VLEIATFKLKKISLEEMHPSPILDEIKFENIIFIGRSYGFILSS
jgi:hypothetical protein